MNARQPSLCLFDAGGPRSAEAALARVKDEGGVVEDVDEACLERAEAEVVLLSVAQAESGPRRRDRAASSTFLLMYKHKPTPVGRRGYSASRDALDEGGERVEAVARGNRVDLERPRQRHERRVVGEGRGRGHGRVGVGRGPELLQPSRRDLGIAVEQDHVARRVGHAPVDAHHEAAARGIVDHGQIAGGAGLRFAQDRLHRGGLRTVDHEKQPMCPLRVAAEARQTATQLFGRAVDRHDHVHGPGRCVGRDVAGPRVVEHPCCV